MPLFVLVAVAALGAIALTMGLWIDLMDWMRFFEGLLFCQFAMLKLFNVPQFAEGFQKYDLIAKKMRLYAYLYPFIELALGLIYLSGGGLMGANVITIVITAIGTFGVVRALRAGLDLRCACMGTVLDVPLSTVTLTEDIGMGVMALLMLLF
jgi:hypothetical protein